MVCKLDSRFISVIDSWVVQSEPGHPATIMKDDNAVNQTQCPHSPPPSCYVLSFFSQNAIVISYNYNYIMTNVFS